MDPNTGLCIKCGSEMYNNTDKNIQRQLDGLKQMPQYACKNKACGNIVWPPRGTTSQQVSTYSGGPGTSQASQSIPRPPARDYDAENTGKCRHAYLLEAFKRGDKLTPKLLAEVNLWSFVSMTGTLPDPE